MLQRGQGQTHADLLGARHGHARRLVEIVSDAVGLRGVVAPQHRLSEAIDPTRVVSRVRLHDNVLELAQKVHAVEDLEDRSDLNCIMRKRQQNTDTNRSLH